MFTVIIFIILTITCVQMSPSRRPLAESSEIRPSVTVTDMDTVHEENDNDR